MAVAVTPVHDAHALRPGGLVPGPERPEGPPSRGVEDRGQEGQGRQEGSNRQEGMGREDGSSRQGQTRNQGGQQQGQNQASQEGSNRQEGGNRGGNR